MGSVSSGAFAACVTAQTGTPSANLSALAGPAGSSAASLAGAIGNANTAFLTQQGSAFVSAPANPAPEQPGGGIWARAVGGEVTLKSTSTSTLVAVRTPPDGTTNQLTSCNDSQRQSFAGVQVGADIARLNWGGWNVHLGTTAGYLGSKSNDSNGYSNSYQIPFFGTYLAATYGRFFADVMVRQEFYNVDLGNATATFFDRPVGAHGYSISTSAGYNVALANNWFIEPSAGFIYSKTRVDDFTYSGTALLGIGGTVSTDDIASEIGRLSMRAGTVIATPNVVWQPFASASVFHEFAGNVRTNFTAFANNGFFNNNPSTYNQQTLTSRVGTYGQYSLGIAGQVVNTGWLGFLRVDYRNGSNIDGWTGNAGLRYQFAPEVIASVMPVKAKAAPHPVIAPTNWTGFYIGGFAGGAYGRTDIGFLGAPTQGSKPYVFGPLGGGQIGYNYQFASNWVLGVEADAGAAHIKGGRTAGPATGLDAFGTPVGFSPAYFTLEDHTNWMATATARAGYSWGRTLYYVRGGAAFEDSTVSANCSLGPTASLGGGARVCRNQALLQTAGFDSGRHTRTGWLIGVGTEFDLGKNWSAKTEYNYIDFGSRDALASDGTTILTEKATVSQVKVGLNYRFSPTAIVAKY
ncbi:autotransporter domain-containing protein [Rhodopseudomonas sp. B29]|uniref:autotransporter domain-containing protein n=1 Tax=Rhodopseudomonas sp. B29 TaxID=95607 RepID=UPI0024C08C05|nr:autotransporter domain-containing protein [Rhodopseudomonas sp. B29]